MLQMLLLAAALRASLLLLLLPSSRVPPLRVLVSQKALPQGRRRRAVSWVPGCHPSSIRGVGEVSSVMVPRIVLVVVRAGGPKVIFGPISPIRRPDLQGSSPTASADAPRLKLKILQLLAVSTIRRELLCPSRREALGDPREPPEHSLNA